MNKLDIARKYYSQGWAPLPVPHGKKKPEILDWPNFRCTAEDLHLHFNGQPSNIGILMGEPSGGLFDVDLDDLEAVRLAPQFLPPTGLKFGRASKPCSHWLYNVTGGTATIKFAKPNKEMIVEGRGDSHQTVFPGSQHPSGEIIEWAEEGEAAKVDRESLVAAIEALALAVCPDLKAKELRVAPSRNPVRTEGDRMWLIQKARDHIAKEPPAIANHGGDEQTYQAASLGAWYGLTESEIFSLMLEYNQRCQPPWPARRIEHYVRQALKYNKPGFSGRSRSPSRDWKPAGTPPAESELSENDSSDLPIVELSHLEFETIAAATDALTANPSGIYQRAGQLVRVVRTKAPADGARVLKRPENTPTIVPCQSPYLRTVLTKICRIVTKRLTDEGEVLAPASPRDWLVKGIEAAGEWGDFPSCRPSSSRLFCAAMAASCKEPDTTPRPASCSSPSASSPRFPRRRLEPPSPRH